MKNLSFVKFSWDDRNQTISEAAQAIKYVFLSSDKGLINLIGWFLFHTHFRPIRCLTFELMPRKKYLPSWTRFFNMHGL